MPQIAAVLGTIVLVVVLFVTEWLPMAVVALLVLVGLALSGLITPAERAKEVEQPIGFLDEPGEPTQHTDANAHCVGRPCTSVNQFMTITSYSSTVSVGR